MILWQKMVQFTVPQNQISSLYLQNIQHFSPDLSLNYERTRQHTIT